MSKKIRLLVDKKAIKTIQEEIKTMEHLIIYVETINHKKYLEKVLAEIKVFLKNIEE
ncbi:MAG: hypothetical protein ACTSYB_08090 [Candidatus Helarchaeota archaeon]